MESPKYNYQPAPEEDDTERWVNEGGHLLEREDSEFDEPDEPLTSAPSTDLDQSQ